MTPASTGGIITYGWTVKEAIGEGVGLSGVDIEFSQFFTDPGYNFEKCNAIDFGELDYINSLIVQSFSFWIKPSSVTSADAPNGYILSTGNGSTDGNIAINLDNYTGEIYIQIDNFLYLYISSVSVGVWTNFAITKDSTIGGQTPKVYQDGVLLSLSSTIPPIAPAVESTDRTGNILRLGGAMFSGAFAWIPIAYKAYNGGLVSDVRIYDTILTSVQINGIVSEGRYGTGYLDDLQFQAPFVKATEYSTRLLLSTDRVLNSIYGETGKPIQTTNLSDIPQHVLPTIYTV